MGLSPFCILSEGEEDEGAGVPYGMGDDEVREALRDEAIDKAPAAAYDSCRHDQHEVERRQMDECVAGRGSYQSRVGAQRAIIRRWMKPRQKISSAGPMTRRSRTAMTAGGVPPFME